MGKYESVNVSHAALMWKTCEIFNTNLFSHHTNLWDQTNRPCSTANTHLICEIINSVQTGMCHKHEVNKGLVFHLTHGKNAFI